MQATSPDPDLLAEAFAAAEALGVTRLADITGLDRIGVPVFHAVRPLSRSLALHQGKGLTRTQAQLGALMEAVECACAEAFDTKTVFASPHELPPEQRPTSLADFASNRAARWRTNERIAWTEGERLTGGQKILVPLDCVSLDYARPWDRRLDHTSNGLAARFDVEGAVFKALLEVLERDARAEWRNRPRWRRALDAIDADTIPYAWFADLAGRLSAAGVFLSLYALPTLIGLPTIAAELFAPASAPSFSAFTGGWSCAIGAEEALMGAILEALQCRLTAIAGARDDILYPGETTGWMGDGAPLPPHLDEHDWCEIADAEPEAATSWQIADRLAAEGYPDTAVVRLTSPGERICVVKVFSPGLAAFGRARRPPELAR